LAAITNGDSVECKESVQPVVPDDADSFSILTPFRIDMDDIVD
jgi:hypothetical protein